MKSIKNIQILFRIYKTKTPTNNYGLNLPIADIIVFINIVTYPSSSKSLDLFSCYTSQEERTFSGLGLPFA